MKKRTAVILAALLIVSLFVFTGCANNDEPLNDNNTGSSASDDIARGVDDIGDGIEKGVDDLGDDLSDTNKNHNKTDGSGIENNNRADNVDNGKTNTTN